MHVCSRIEKEPGPQLQQGGTRCMRPPARASCATFQLIELMQPLLLGCPAVVHPDGGGID